MTWRLRLEGSEMFRGLPTESCRSLGAGCSKDKANLRDWTILVLTEAGGRCFDSNEQSDKQHHLAHPANKKGKQTNPEPQVSNWTPLALS